MIVKHYHHHYRLVYYTSLKRHLYSTSIILFLLGLILIFAFRTIFPSSPTNLDQFSPLNLLTASFGTIFRLTFSYILALFFSVPLALWVTSSPKLEKILLPVFDIIQSVPILAFFPIIVLVFVKANFFDGAAIFILFMAMLWNMVFSMVGGLKTIPADIEFAAKAFGATGVKKLLHVTLPAITPYIITGSFLAWAQGWNIMIVAEVIHTYIPGGNSSNDLLGLGSLLVNSVSSGQTIVFLSTLVMMIILIGALNFFVWQKLLGLTQRYKFD